MEDDKKTKRQTNDKKTGSKTDMQNEKKRRVNNDRWKDK